MDDQCQCAADYYQDDDDDDFDCEFDYCYKDSKCQVNGDSNRVCKSRYCLCKTGYAADANNGQKCIKSTAISTTAIISTTAWPPFTWPWDDEYTTKGSYNNGVPFWSWGWVFIALPIIVCSIVGICVNHKRKLRRLQNHMVILRPQPAQVQGQGQSQGQVPYMSQAVYPNQYEIPQGQGLPQGHSYPLQTFQSQPYYNQQYPGTSLQQPYPPQQPPPYESPSFDNPTYSTITANTTNPSAPTPNAPPKPDNLY